jgi:SAM-dependent methyltransferase
MRRAVLESPVWGGKRLSLEAYEEDGEHVMEGVLRTADGEWFPILRGVPCFLRGKMRPELEDFRKRHGLPAHADDRARDADAKSAGQELTASTFSDKWSRFKNYGMQESEQRFLFDWYCKKLGVKDTAALRAFYAKKRTVLEVGPGSGFNTRFIGESTASAGGQVFALDISEAAFTTFENTRLLPNCHVVQADLMDMPFAGGVFDFVIADGVLHHTPSTKSSVQAIVKQVRPGGQVFFYVYRRMGAARAFCDEYLRSHLSKLTPDECYAACEGLTELGRELSRVKAAVHLERGIPELGIPPGDHDVQRLVYYNFVKCFWNDAFDHETNNMVNFDWYHPHFAWQHTEDEVRGWMAELGIASFQFMPANPNGISTLATIARG